MIFLDSETTSLHGMIVLLQYAIDDGPVILHEVWKKPFKETLTLIEQIVNHDEGVVMFNASFDWFHICKLYTTFNLAIEKGIDENSYPIDYINKLGVLEKEARDSKCLKPYACLDLMLIARKGPYQSTMERKPIIIKKVPSTLAYPLADYLERTIRLKDIYFAKRKNKYEPKWKVEDFEYKDGTKDNEFKNIVLRFNATNALKALAVDCLDIDKKEVLLYGDITIDQEYIPSEKKKEEFGYAPFALAVAPDYQQTGNWKGSWPEKIKYHIQHWSGNKLHQRDYAEDDVIYTRKLYQYFGRPPMNDDDSVLACLVAACRWKGFSIDLDKIENLRNEAIKLSKSAPTAPEAVREYIYTHLSDTERVVLQQKGDLVESTKKVVLENIAKQTTECGCVERKSIAILIDNSPHPLDRVDDSIRYKEEQTIVANPQCNICSGTGHVNTEAAKLAQRVLKARLANYEINFFEKLLIAGRLHADFNVIGTLSSRMSGGGGLNTHGIRGTKEVRGCFTFKWDDYVFCGGDFVSFEVVIAEAKYNDHDLRQALQTIITCPFCNGSKKHDKCNGRGCKECKNKGVCPECKGTGNHKQTIHGLFGTFMYPGKSYVDILRTKGTAKDLYTQAKRGVFLKIYGGTSWAMEERIGIEREIADRAVENFDRRYKGVGQNIQKIKDKFCSIKQPDGIGSRIYWNEPPEYVESMLGFRRYFTLENNICKALFELAQDPPKEWLKLKTKVTRRDREQTIGGAVRSALFACAFNIQGQNTRAATNHEIQSTGAQITKGLECKIWELQPSGVHDWNIAAINVHDEILCVVHPTLVDRLKKIVTDYVDSMKNVIPLLEIDFKTHLNSWADK